jgi:DNA polymerase III subunit epsilon
VKVLDPCGCFPTGRHYPGVAHLIRVRAVGVATEVAADAAWTDCRVAFVDTETTGRDPMMDRLVEVGVVIGENGRVIERYSWLVNPMIPIPAESTAVHGITDSDVADKPPFEAVALEIAKVLEGAIPAAYNALFDRGFLIAELDRARVVLSDPPPALRREVDWVDPLVFARELYQAEESRALGDMAARLGIALERAHRATDDAEAALLVLYAFAKDPRVPKGYAALVQEQRRLGREQDEVRKFWRRPN